MEGIPTWIAMGGGGEGGDGIWCGIPWLGLGFPLFAIEEGKGKEGIGFLWSSRLPPTVGKGRRPILVKLHKTPQL